MNTASYTIVIPCHNEAARLRLSAFRSFQAVHPEASLLFVDDGSTDDTVEKLYGFDVLRLSRNYGKAEAVRAGVLYTLAQKTPPDYIAFLDADLATPLQEIDRLVTALEANGNLSLAMGSRWIHLGSGVHRSPLRALEGRLMAMLIRLATRMPVYDSQCGAKVFRAPVAKALFREPFISRWLFDVELLLRLPNGASRATEVPLKRWHEVAGSKLSFWASLRSLLELPRIVWYTHRLKTEGKLACGY